MTETDVGDLLKRVLGAFPTQRQKMSPADLAGFTVSYTAGLIDLDFDLARRAIERCNKTSNLIPTIAAIRAEVLELERGAARTGIEAWGDVLRAVGRFGTNGTPTFADPLVAEAIAAVGWRAVCQSDDGDPSVRAKFVDAYNAISRRARKEAQVSRGAGARELGSGEARTLGALVAGVMPKERP